MTSTYQDILLAACGAIVEARMNPADHLADLRACNWLAWLKIHHPASYARWTTPTQNQPEE